MYFTMQMADKTQSIGGRLHVENFTFQPLCFCCAVRAICPCAKYCNVASLSLVYNLYLRSRCSDKHLSSFCTVQAFEARMNHTKFTDSNHPHFFCASNIKRNFHPERYFPRSTILWNSHPRDIPWKRQSWRLQIKGQLLAILLVFSIFTSYHFLY